MAETVAILSGSYVTSDGLTMEDLIWRAVNGTNNAAEFVLNCDFLLMVSVDSLDARGISCMTVGGLLHRIPEHTRVDNGAFALLLAYSMVAANDTTVCILGWEKPTDASLESLVAMAGEPHYERPLCWTAGIEEALGASRHHRSLEMAEVGRPIPHDRAACIVLGRNASATTTMSARLSARRIRERGDAQIATSPLQYPSQSPVDPLQRVAELVPGTLNYAAGAAHQVDVSVYSPINAGVVSGA